MRAVVIGHVEWIDFLRVESVPRPGEIVHASETWAEAAGGGAVAAVQLANLGCETSLFTALGDDELGRRSEWELTSKGVQLHVAWVRAPQRRGVTYVDEAGERTITVIGEKHRPRGDDESLPWEELHRTDCVYFTAGNVEALLKARHARVLVATARELPTLRLAGVELDALVGSATDAGERYEAGALVRSLDRRARPPAGHRPRGRRPRRSGSDAHCIPVKAAVVFAAGMVLAIGFLDRASSVRSLRAGQPGDDAPGRAGGAGDEPGRRTGDPDRGLQRRRARPVGGRTRRRRRLARAPDADDAARSARGSTWKPMSFLVLALSVLAWQYGKAGAWVLLCGLMRYGFVAAGWLWPWLRGPLSPTRPRKIDLRRPVRRPEPDDPAGDPAPVQRPGGRRRRSRRSCTRSGSTCCGCGGRRKRSMSQCTSYRRARGARPRIP